MKFALICLLLVLPWKAIHAQPEKPSVPDDTPTPEEVFETGARLFDEFAPDEIKRQVVLPTNAQWNEFARRLQAALDGNRLEDLIAYEPQARAALAAWRTLPGFQNYTDWLERRLDYIEAAKLAVKNPAGARVRLPYYSLWVQRVRAQPRPPRADEFMPRLRQIFSTAGLPPELAWLAEVESAFDPEARSPVGARGLYQLMPATAQELGLSAVLPDERADPRKNARAAAKYLSELHRKFGEWPLALAAYNAGAGRISRALAASKGKTFADIAGGLSAETRMYVPKVLATVAVRTGIDPEKLSAPRLE